MGELVCSEEGSLTLSCRNSWEESVSLYFLDENRDWRFVSCHLPIVGPTIHVFNDYFIFVGYLQVLSAICSAGE